MNPKNSESAASRLRLRRLPVDTYREAVAYLPRNSTIYRPASGRRSRRAAFVG
jgi:hypothetical protein